MKVSRAQGETLYRMMTRIRVFENRVADLVEAGEVKTPCHLYVGQEAVAAGVCAALEPRDYVWGGHRSHGHYLAKGGDLRQMMAEIFCKFTGCSEGRGGSMHLFAPEVGVLGTVPLVAATIPLAVGTALAGKLRKDGSVSVPFFGDGATEEGHFHESMNLAAVYKLPVIFVCENNFYASHLGLLERRAADNIAKSGEAHGVAAEAVDGNDVAAVVAAAGRAVARARAGEGPTLLECRTFRWRGHVGASFDMDVGVRRKDELDAWLEKDPITRLRQALETEGMDAAAFDRIEQEAKAEVEEAVTFARQSPHPPESELLRHVYARPVEQAR
jgi:acetoin:2,6-dichlorophenolindophenol oxidoreductase subunit alpha